MQAEPLLFGSPVGRAIHVLVTQPLAERVPADYRRVVLDRYRANETCYLPADVRARIAATADGGAWRQTPRFERIVADLVSRCLWLEDAMDATPVSTARQPTVAGQLKVPALTDADLVGWLGQPERLGPVGMVRPEVQRAWNIRAVLIELANRGTAGTPASDMAALNLSTVLSQVYRRLTSRLREPSTFNSSLSTAAHHAAPLRTSSLILPGTVYCPPADPWLIETCFEHVLRVATAITDPVERAFFLATHLLYLLPFPMFNPTMALLTMNVPLLLAGLPPVTLAAAQPSDLLAGIRGVWELNRTELLRDAFVAALGARGNW